MEADLAIFAPVGPGRQDALASASEDLVADVDEGDDEGECQEQHDCDEQLLQFVLGGDVGE